MPIPKGLIIYKASRYQESYSFHLKHLCYSDKILLSTETKKPDHERIYSWRYQPKITNITKVPKVMKMTQKLSLYLEADSQRNIQIIRYFLKLRNMKKCFIHFHKESVSFSKVLDCSLAQEMIQKVFKTSRSLKEIELIEMGSLQKDHRTFKYLVQQRSLQSLTLIDLKYTSSPKDLEPFLQLSRSVSKRNCWPHFQQLKIDLAPSEEEIPHYYGRFDSTGTLKNLLQFLQDFKSCKSLYKLSNLQLRFPDKENPNCKEIAAFDKILKMQLPITHISSWQSKQISKIFDLTEHLQNLQGLSFKLHDYLDDYLDTAPLVEFPALEEFKFHVYCSNEDDDESPQLHFYYSTIEEIRNMKNLRSLSLHFDGDRGDVQSEVSYALANLSELIHLKLRFAGFPEDEGTFIQINRSWLGKIFQEIGKKKKLRELSLQILTFDFPDSTKIFKIFCQSLGKLAKLTSLNFRIDFADSIKDQGVATLVPYLNNLEKLESLSLRIGGSQYKSSTFILLLDSIMKNFPFLSDLNLEIHDFDVTKQCYQLIYKAIHQMKCLNRMDILIGGKLGRGLKITLLDAEVRKRMEGSVYCYSFKKK